MSLLPLHLVSKSKRPPPTAPRCSECKLDRGCQSPKMPYSGKGKKGILIVGEAPGIEEDQIGRQFVGVTGRFLQERLLRLGVDLREDCWLMNAVSCYPKDSKGKQRTPTDLEVDHCRPSLTGPGRALDILKPRVIIPLGGVAVRSLIGWLWKEDPEGISRWVGWRIPSQKLNAYICPNWHPSFLLRSRKRGEDDPTLLLLFDRFLKRAVRLENRPYEEIVDYKRQVVLIHDPAEAANEIRGFVSRNQPVAWDIETTTLKPDGKDADIVCCSISDGDKTIAFPWVGEAVTAMCEFVLSPVPKMGWNVKFETRWIKKVFGKTVRNWVWDGMLAAHTLDNRPGITSLKFQAFIKLGVESYNDDIAPKLEGEGGNGKNRVREVDLPKLLTYCALDSLYEFKVGKIQMKELGYE